MGEKLCTVLRGSYHLLSQTVMNDCTELRLGAAAGILVEAGDYSYQCPYAVHISHLVLALCVFL